MENLCLNTVFAAVEHYFPHLTQYFRSVDDFRQQGKIKYPAELILWLGLFERLSGVKSNNEFEMALKTATEIENNLLPFLNFPVDELPSIDDFCYFFQHLSPVELHQVRRKMLMVLERKKILKKLMPKDGCLLLAIDGVQTMSTKRKIAHSTFRNHDGAKTYHQYFLEAKIISPDGLAISVDTEFIENPSGEFNKQDCEPKAAARLLERVRREHPHLKFRILGDALYCNSVVMDACESRRWKYSFTFKGETKHPKLLEEINCELNYRQRDNRWKYLLKKNKRTELRLELSWCNDLKYSFGANGERSINYLSGKVIRIKDGVETEITTFAYLVSEATSQANAFRKFMDCRKRWKIENEGFNFQKNNILNIGHSFSSVGHAGQNFYLLAQIAHMILQLACFTDVAGQIRRLLTGETDNLSQSLKNIFQTFAIIALRIRIELLEKIFKPPPIPQMRIRLKFA
ncbi:MAG: transposase family protein [Patescibacteria group bacterium]|nr:transposase family protein [Patescibacteria group bacterium]